MNGDTSSVISGTPQLTTTAITGSAPGTYPINVQRKLNAANYNFTYVNGTLTVTQASQDDQLRRAAKCNLRSGFDPAQCKRHRRVDR